MHCFFRSLHRCFERKKDPQHIHYIPTRTHQSSTGGGDRKEDSSRFGDQCEQFCSSPPCHDIQGQIYHLLEAILGIFFFPFCYQVTQWFLTACYSAFVTTSRIEGQHENNYSLATHHSNNLFCKYCKSSFTVKLQPYTSHTLNMNVSVILIIVCFWTVCSCKSKSTLRLWNWH